MATNNKLYIKLWKKKTLRHGKVTEFSKRLINLQVIWETTQLLIGIQVTNNL